MKLKDIIRLLLLTPLLAACSTDADILTADGEGRLRLDLSNVSSATRSIPADLGVPTAEDFHLRITNSAGRAVYDNAFTTEELTLTTGNYTVRATYGDNPLMGIDTPYYIAESTATITADQTTDLQLHASVGNALISAVFGQDEEEHQRFERFYSDYSLKVHIGDNSIAISRGAPGRSVYVQPGNKVTISFWGKLKMENDREVQTQLTSADFPETFSAADHAIVTLTLPDPESAMTVDIAKVELEDVTLDETIPLSWLPVPIITATHQFTRNGNLAGTDLAFTDNYPGLTWRAIVTNAAGTEVRRIQGEGALTSTYSSSAEWPYLPQGKYKATFYLIGESGTAKTLSSREFMVGAPTFAVSVNGYTSYTKYLEGDIEAANACDRLTVYEPSVHLGIERSLLTNSNYSYTFTYTYDGGTATTVAPGLVSYYIGNLTGQEVRSAAHVLRADATFDGVTATAQQGFQITGLPYALNLAEHDEWSSSSGVDWFENDVRLGHLSTGGQTIRTDNSICLPPATYFCADYHVNVHTLTVGTTFSIQCGSQEILTIEEAGTPFRDTDHIHEGTTGVFHDDSQFITNISCNNSYGAGQTCSHIYALSFRYANH